MRGLAPTTTDADTYRLGVNLTATAAVARLTFLRAAAQTYTATSPAVAAYFARQLVDLAGADQANVTLAADSALNKGLCTRCGAINVPGLARCAARLAKGRNLVAVAERCRVCGVQHAVGKATRGAKVRRVVVASAVADAGAAASGKKQSAAQSLTVTAAARASKPSRHPASTAPGFKDAGPTPKSTTATPVKTSGPARSVLATPAKTAPGRPASATPASTSALRPAAAATPGRPGSSASSRSATASPALSATGATSSKKSATSKKKNTLRGLLKAQQKNEESSKPKTLADFLTSL
ncbi:hypothetical protein GGF31_000025 [Allomyces arbusculus]|nr:hypothetical protein GGF31_000025 [Allomyces arbusculus]